MPVQSLYPRVDIPNADIYNFLFDRKTKWPGDTIIFEDPETERRYTYDDLKAAVLDFGKGLRAVWDWKKDDVLGFYSPNNIDVPVCTFGALWAGAICSPANPSYTVDELAFQLKDSGAKALVTQAAQLEPARQACKKAGIPEDHIILVGNERDPNGRFKHFTSIRNTAGSTRFRKARIDPDKDLAFLVYSSGTTGTPKGVMLSHKNIISNILQSWLPENGKLDWTPTEQPCVLACLPFFHIYGLTTLMHYYVFVGAKCIVMPRFDLEKWCAAVQKYRVKFCNVVPPIVLLLAKQPAVSNYDLSSLQMTSSGGAPLSAELQRAVWDRLKVPVKQGYGLSETAPTTHSQTWDEREWRDKVGSVGKLFPNMEAKYMTSPDDDERGEVKEVPNGTPGELYLRGPNIFKGYWKRPKETEQCLDKEGWFRTGDVGYQDDKGNFYITDRVKELIKYKGFQVPPAELEGLLLQHPYVEDAIVVGVNSEKLRTELPRAYLVRKGGMSAVKDSDAQEVIDWMAKKVVNHKRLRGGVKFVETVPKSPSGKLLRRFVRDKARQEYAEEEKAQVSAKL